MNPYLARLEQYPFERLRLLFDGIKPNPDYSPINLAIGEPKHLTPAFIKLALADHLEQLAYYPTTKGMLSLRTAISQWITQRYQVPLLNPETEILPVNGSREALFSFAQAVLDPTTSPTVIIVNPFYQIYEGATLLAGAKPYYVNVSPETDYQVNWQAIPRAVWQNTRLIYVCSPNNPTGQTMTLSDWQTLFECADRYNCIVASDECYSEIYFPSDAPPLGALSAAHQLKGSYGNIVCFNSLSKRSNVPGMRSGFVAGDEKLLKQFLLYRTYHGSAMNPAVQIASQYAWQDENHVIENRRLYTEKFDSLLPRLQKSFKVKKPNAGFYLWLETEDTGEKTALTWYQHFNLTVLPGAYLAREVQGVNPGAHFIRIALVAPLAECIDACDRILQLV